jgi:hypothetical protein
MDPFSAGREGEEELFGYMRTDADEAENNGGEEGGADGSEFLNDSGPGMELEDGDDGGSEHDNDGGSEDVGPPEVYYASSESLHDAIIISSYEMLLMNVSSSRPPHRPNLLEGNEAMPKGCPLKCIL